MTTDDPRVEWLPQLLDHTPARGGDGVTWLREERDDLARTLARVVANESNHYDRYWSPPDEALSAEWLDDTEVKMRDSLTDAFCDDAAAIMLTLIAEVRRLRAQLADQEAP